MTGRTNGILTGLNRLVDLLETQTLWLDFVVITETGQRNPHRNRNRNRIGRQGTRRNGRTDILVHSVKFLEKLLLKCDKTGPICGIFSVIFFPYCKNSILSSSFLTEIPESTFRFLPPKMAGTDLDEDEDEQDEDHPDPDRIPDASKASNWFSASIG